MEITQIADKIELKIKQLNELRKQLPEKASNKVTAQATYEKVLAKTIIRLKNGEEFELDGAIVSNPIASVTEKIAKGICWECSLEANKLDLEYKNHLEIINIVQAQLNGYQSIFKHLN